MRLLRLLLVLFSLLALVDCGQTQANDLATRGSFRPPTIALPTPPTPVPPAIATADAAITAARGAVSPYMATWQDVIATEESGVWRVAFRNLEPYPPGAPGADDYWRNPLVVFVDAKTGIVLRQGYL
jgi:hypothetical protein